MSYKTTWFSKRDLRRLCQSVANLCDIELTAEMLCDQINGEGEIAGGGYGGNVEEKLIRQGVSREDAEMLLAELAESEPAILSTTEAAEILGVSEQRIRQLCESGRMGRRVGRDWVITPEDIEANKVRKPGRPPVWETLELDRIDHLRLTRRGAEVLRERIPVRDLADELKPGMVITYRTFVHEGGQAGALLVVHEGRNGRIDRAGIFFGGPSVWGDWDEETWTVRLDETDEEGLPVVYDAQGRRVID